MEEQKIDKIQEKIDELNWSDEDVPEILEGFYNNPSEAIDLSKCSKEHLQSLWELLECEIDDKGD